MTREELLQLIAEALAGWNTTYAAQRPLVGIVRYYTEAAKIPEAAK